MMILVVLGVLYGLIGVGHWVYWFDDKTRDYLTFSDVFIALIVCVVVWPAFYDRDEK